MEIKAPRQSQVRDKAMKFPIRSAGGGAEKQTGADRLMQLSCDHAVVAGWSIFNLPD
jgi:hypothetical protein